MKICMVGLGSIGKRHLRNLTGALDRRKTEYRIDAVRSGSVVQEKGQSSILRQQYVGWEEVPDDYDIIFVTNPTSLHYETIKAAAGRTKHMFIEKPVFDSVSYPIEALGLKRDGIYYVACPLRHKSILKYVKEHIMKCEKVIAARMISTSYLPSWRKEADYRSAYSAKRNMGGGVTLDLIHEWDYAVDLFGYPDKVMHVKEHISDLETDTDDISIYMAKYPEMILEIHLDYFGHKTERILQMFTNRKRIDVDLIHDSVCEYENDIQTGSRQFPPEDCYVNEMEYFLDCIEKNCENINTIETAYETLKIAVTRE